MLIETVASFGIVMVMVAAALTTDAASARTADGWVAVANSPSRESLDWNTNVSRQAAESTALRPCVTLQNAKNCRIVASGPQCVAVAWDTNQPLNRPYGAVADTPAAALNAAIAAAGTYANDPTVRCSYLPQQPSSGNPPGRLPRQIV
ncbi:hypothetical protein NGTWS1803_02750 [Mycolicibacterium cyprinidarum]|nr:hypothetical protein NGTWS1803_02750 [Mycolicibacterium sp. NGTWS1803]